MKKAITLITGAALALGLIACGASTGSTTSQETSQAATEASSETEQSGGGVKRRQNKER